MSAPPWVELEAIGWLTLINPDTAVALDVNNITASLNDYDDSLFGDGNAGEKIINAMYTFVKAKPECRELWQPDSLDKITF